MTNYTHNRILHTIRIFTVGVLAFVSLMLFHTTQAAPTYTMNYQGKLTGASGVAVADGTYNMRFWLTTSATIATTSALWTEELTSTNKVQVTNGLFSIMLGSTTPLTGIDWNQPLYLGVEVGGTTTPAWDGEMSPRKILGTVPSAFEAKNARTIDNIATTSLLRSDQDDTASGLLTFTGGLISTASSTITNLTTLIATTTTLVINNSPFTSLTGTGLTNTGGVLTATLGTDITVGEIADGDHGFFSYASGIASLDTNGLTSSNLLSALTDETGTNLAVFNTNPLLQGFRSSASSTIGDGTGAGGLTIAGNSTTTGNAYFGGLVGINTTAQLYDLHVKAQNSGHATLMLESTGNEAIMILDSFSPHSWTVRNDIGGRLHFKTSGVYDTDYFIAEAGLNSNVIPLYITSLGNIGIATSTPASKLTVAGDIYSTGNITVASSTLGYASSTALSVTGNTYIGGTLGIGTTSPSALLALVGSPLQSTLFRIASTSGASLFEIAQDGSLNVNNGGITYDATTDVTTIANLALGTTMFDTDGGMVTWVDMLSSSTPQGTAIGYSAQIDGNPLLTVYGESDGAGGTQNLRVGIGSTTPLATLAVTGSGTDDLFRFASSSGTNLLTLSGTGVLTHTGNIITSGLLNTSALTVTGSSTLGYASSTALTVSGNSYFNFASSTYASTTGLTASNLSLLGTLRDGAGSAGTNGYVLQTTGSGTQWVATSTLGFSSGSSFTDSAGLAALLSDETGTAGAAVFSQNPLLQGFRSSASSTIGDGTGAGGLTIAGNSTTTGNAYFAGNVGVGTSSPWAKLSIQDTPGSLQSLFDIATTTSAGYATSSIFKVNADGSVYISSATINNVVPSNILTIDGGINSASSYGRKISITGGSSNNIGGEISLAGGQATGIGGTVYVRGGGASGGTGFGGAVALYGGNSAATGGAVGLYGGTGSSTGGGVLIEAGDATNFLGSGASVNISGGDALSGLGGDVVLNPGYGDLVGTPYHGDILLATLRGKVGIGSTTPSRLLTVAGDAIMANLMATGTATTTNLAVTGKFYDGANSAGTNGMVLQTTGSGTQWVATSSLGIVTTADDLSDNSIEDLSDVAAMTKATGNLLSWNGSTWTNVATSSLGLGDGTFLGLSDTPSSYTTSAIPYVSGSGLAFNSNFVFDGTNLGIGTNAPGAMLDIFGASNGLRLSYDASNYAELTVDSNGLLSINSTGAGGAGSGYVLGSGLAEDTFTIYDGNTQDYYIGLDDTDSLLKIGLGSEVGTTTLLSLSSGTTTINTALYATTSSTNTALTVAQSGAGDILNLFSAGTEVFSVLGSGYVGIGTTTPSAKLSVTGTAGSGNIFAFASSTNSNLLTLGADGRLTFGNPATANILLNGGATSTNPLVGTSNVAIGNKAFSYYGSGATYNIALGEQALYGSSSVPMTGGENVAMGYQALMRNTSGSYNNAFGSNAMTNNLSGSHNNAFGNLSLSSNTVGSKNIAFGRLALFSNITGSSNIALGDMALLSNIRGSHNTALGEESGSSIGSTATSSYNTYIGYQAGYGQTQGDNNIVIGSNAGYNLGTATSTTFLGAMTNTINGAISTSTALGAGALLAQSNTMVLGGTGANAVSIVSGTSTPWAKLSIMDNYGNTQALFDVATTTSSAYATSSLFRVAHDGRVSIGSTTPESRTLTIDKSGLTGSVVGGIKEYLQFTNSTESALYYGDNTYIVNAPTATSTLIGSILRIADDSTLGNTVRGLEVQSHRGANTKGENTGVNAYGRTFGLKGTTEGDAGSVLVPAGVYAETRGTTQGNALRAYSGSITTANLVSVFHDTSAFTGTGLNMNLGNSGGSFSGTNAKFLDFQIGGTSKFMVTAQGTTTIGDGTTNNMAGLQIGYGGLCVDNDGSCTASTTGRITSVSSASGNSDLAEMYFSADALESGEIVALAGGLSITRATHTDTNTDTNTIIGVISTKPGVIMGYDDTSLTQNETAYPVALKGRVPVKLSTENGPIHKGDRITLSSIPGVGMKAEGHSTTVGIALEDWEGDTAYTDTYLNQFGDDLVKAKLQPLNQNTDTRTQDGCSYGGGVATGDKPCVKDKVSTIKPQTTTVDTKTDALNALKAQSATTTRTPNGQEVTIGQAIMFVQLAEYFPVSETNILAELTSTSTVFEGKGETLWDRIKTLAQGFVDGVLRVAGLKTDELCVGNVCVDEATFLKMVESADGTVQNAGPTTPPEPPPDPTNSPDPGGESTPPPEEPTVTEENPPEVSPTEAPLVTEISSEEPAVEEAPTPEAEPEPAPAEETTSEPAP